MKTFFITGIDTDVGKTYVTGMIAKYLKRKNISVITQKLVQTGNIGVSDDIKIHRKIMGENCNEFDKQAKTCPYIFSFPSSPHLSAEMDNAKIDFNIIDKCTKELKDNFDCVLIEGAGGIYVPLNRTETIMDFIKVRSYPVIVVTSSKLGSLNHTLLTIEALKNNNVEIAGIVYNRYPEESIEIAKDTISTIKNFYPEINIIDFPKMEIDNLPYIDFSTIL